MKNEQLTDPAVLPVTIDRLRDHLRVRHDLEDSLYLEYLEAATQLVEEWTERAFITRTFRWTNWNFAHPDDSQIIEIPVTPLVSIESIKYYDADDAEQTLAATEYYIEGSEQVPACVYPVNPWPVVKERYDAVWIDYTAGHGETPADMPAKLRLVLCQLVEHFNRHRGPIESSGVSELPLSTRSLINSLKVGSYA